MTDGWIEEHRFTKEYPDGHQGLIWFSGEGVRWCLSSPMVDPAHDRPEIVAHGRADDVDDAVWECDEAHANSQGLTTREQKGG